MQKFFSKIKTSFGKVVKWFSSMFSKIKTKMPAIKSHYIKQKQSFMKLWRFSFKIARIITLAVVGALLVYGLISEVSTMEAQDFVHSNYKQSTTNVYVDNNLDVESQQEKVDEVLSLIPKYLLDEINDNWMILISKECPFESFVTNGTVKGTTYYLTNTIWMHPDFTSHELAHEFGHVLSFKYGEIANSKDFKNIYKNNWNQYVDYGKTVIETHCISSSSEYFAQMFAEYIYYPDYLKEYNNEVYNYMDDITHDYWRMSWLGLHHGTTFRMFRTVWEKISNFGNNITYSCRNTFNNISIVFNKKIDINNYEINNDQTYKHPETEEIINIVHDVIANPDKYPDIITYNFYYNVKFEAYLETRTVLMFYFMDESTSFVHFGTSFDHGNIITPVTLDKQMLLNANKTRNEHLEKAEVVLSDMKSGSDTQILMQLADYIIDNCQYSLVFEDAKMEQFWNGSGNDKTYAMAFQLFAQRLGYECDIVMAPMETGIDHVFNRVKLNDGTYRYFDLTRSELNQVNVEQSDLIVYSVNSLPY